MNYIASLSRLLSRYCSWVVIAAAVASALWPQSFAWVQQGQRPSVILGIIMLTMGCTLSTDDFKVLLRRPLDILLGTLAQFTVMPFVAYGLTRLFGLDPFLSAGIILVGCCPGGVSSNIMSFLCHGDVAFSVGMTTVSTLLAPLVTPLMVLWLAGQQIEVDALGMFQNICVVTLLPVACGCAFNYFLGKRDDFKQIQSVMPGISVICLALIVGGVIFTVMPRLSFDGSAATLAADASATMMSGWHLLLLTLAVVTCHNGLGYLLGYLLGSLFGFNVAKRRTISIEVGMQNAGMATVLAGNFFATPAAIAANPLAAITVVPCAISCAYHSISGTILATWFARNDRPQSNL